MLALSINNITLRHKLKTTKAQLGNATGSSSGSINGGTNPQKRFTKIYEYNRIRKTEPRSTRGPVFREIQRITRQIKCDRNPSTKDE